MIEIFNSAEGENAKIMKAIDPCNAICETQCVNYCDPNNQNDWANWSTNSAHISAWDVYQYII